MTSVVSHQLNPKLTKVALIAAAAVASMSLGVWQAVAPEQAAIVLLALIYIALAICKLEAAIVVYTLTAFMVIGPVYAVTGRFGYTDGFFTSELMLGLLVLVWGARLLSLAIRNKRVVLNSAPINLPLLCLIATAIFAFIAAQFTWDDTVPIEHRYLLRQVTDIGLLCMPVTACIMVGNVIRGVRWAKAVYGAVLVVGIIGFCVNNHWLRMPGFVRLFWWGLLPVPLISFLYAHVLLREKFDWRLLVAIVALAALLFYQFAFLSWVVMWFSTAISLCVITWHRSKKLAIMLACVVLLLIAYHPSMITRVYETEAAQRSTERIDLWRSAIQMAMRRPVWGIGPGNFYPYYSHHYAKEYGTINVSSPHSNYVQIMVEYGLLGVACFVWFIIACLKMLKDSLALAKTSWQRTFFLGMNGYFAGMAAAAFLADYLVSSSSNSGLASFSTTIYTWLLLGVACGLRRQLLLGKETTAVNPQVSTRALTADGETGCATPALHLNDAGHNTRS